MLVKKADKSAVFDGYLSNSSGTLSPRAPLLLHCFLLHALALSRFFDSLLNRQSQALPVYIAIYVLRYYLSAAVMMDIW